MDGNRGVGQGERQEGETHKAAYVSGVMRAGDFSSLASAHES